MAMSPHEFLHVLDRAKQDTHLARRILDALDQVDLLWQGLQTAADGVDVGRYGHDRFLPAARVWQEHIRGARRDRSTAAMRRARGRLGGCSRWLYARQEKSFKSALRLLLKPLPVDPPDWLVDRCWRRIRELESGLLAASRKR
jgi:hypothetical protein